MFWELQNGQLLLLHKLRRLHPFDVPFRMPSLLFVDRTMALT